MYTLDFIAQYVNGTVVGDASIEVSSVGSIASAKPGEITFLSNAKYQSYLPLTKASVVILAKEHIEQNPTNSIVVKKPALAFAKVSLLFEDSERIPAGIHPTAIVASSASIGVEVRIGPYVTIGKRVTIGDRVEIGAGTNIAADCSIGRDSRLFPSVTLYEKTRLGARCIVHSGSIIGADGFGLEHDDRGVMHRIAQLGGVLIGDDVLVGAGCTIDCGAIDDTVLEDGVKLDDQVHIGHNCRVGAHSILCGCAGLAGSVTLGRHCIMGGGVGVAGDGPLKITDNVTVGSMTFVSRDILDPGVYSGNVLHNTNPRWRRNAMRFNELDEMAKRLKKLEKLVGQQSDFD